MTEKSEALRAEGKYVFLVSPRANKELVRQAVRSIFDVTPVAVNIVNVRGKKRRFRNTFAYASDKKKAIVTLKEGDSIEIYEGS